jgi:hypothetical protein
MVKKKLMCLFISMYQGSEVLRLEDSVLGAEENKNSMKPYKPWINLEDMCIQ